MRELVIETKDLNKKYRGRYAVRNLNLEIGRGEIYGFLGERRGQNDDDPDAARTHPPDDGLHPHFRQGFKKGKAEHPPQGRLAGGISVQLRASDGGAKPGGGAPHIGCAEIADRRGAEHRIVDQGRQTPGEGVFARDETAAGHRDGLLGNPELLILDEPTNGLDPEGIHEIRELIRSMPQQHGITVLVSSHLLSEVEQMAGTVGIIREGELVFQDTISNLQQQASGGFRLVVSEPAEALQLIRGQGYAGRLEDGGLRLDQLSNPEVALLVKRLVHHNHAIYRVEEKRRTLEDIFMQVIEQGGFPDDRQSVVVRFSENSQKRHLVSRFPRLRRAVSHAGFEFWPTLRLLDRPI